MKKTIALLAALGMSVSLLAGCGSSASSSAASSEAASSEAASSSAAADSDLDYIKGNGKMVIGYTVYAPMNYTDDEGNFLWPGFGDNLRVLDWILKRCAGEIDAVETAIGYEPKPEDINIDGLDMTADDVANLLTVDKDLWKEEVAGIREFYAKFGEKVPAELKAQLETLASNLDK